MALPLILTVTGVLVLFVGAIKFLRVDGGLPVIPLAHRRFQCLGISTRFVSTSRHARPVLTSSYRCLREMGTSSLRNGPRNTGVPTRYLPKSDSAYGTMLIACSSVYSLILGTTNSSSSRRKLLSTVCWTSAVTSTLIDKMPIFHRT